MIKFKKVQRLAGGICACVLLFHTMLQPVYAAEIAGVDSPVYVVIDSYSGEILYSRNKDQSIYPASTVKLVTAMVVLDAADKDKKITITNQMLGTFPSDVAKIGLKAGGVYTVYELLELLLVSSAADAAEALAVGCFGSTEECLKKMNEKVAAMGLTKTHFDNTVGLDIGNNFKNTYTTAAEFAALSRMAMTYPEIREIVRVLEYTLPARTNNAAITRKTTNLFLRDTYEYPKDLYTVIGTKTGITKAAGRTLIATATDGTHEVICLTYLNPDTEVMYTSAEKALTYTFTQNKQNKIQLTTAVPSQTNPGNTTNPGNSAGPGGVSNSGNSAGPGGVSNSGSSAGPGGVSNSGSSVGPGGVSNSGSSVGPGGVSNSGSSAGPGGVSNPGSSAGPGGVSNSGNSTKPGSSNSGNSAGSSGNSSAGSSVKPGTSTNPGSSANSGKVSASDIGWKKASNGSWNYYLADGKKKTGWLIDDKYEWYYFDTSGTMQTGWVKWSEKWYYMDKSSGKMVVSTTTPDGYVVGPDGAWIE